MTDSPPLLARLEEEQRIRGHAAQTRETYLDPDRGLLAVRQGKGGMGPLRDALPGGDGSGAVEHLPGIESPLDDPGHPER